MANVYLSTTTSRGRKRRGRMLTSAKLATATIWLLAASSIRNCGAPQDQEDIVSTVNATLLVMGHSWVIQNDWFRMMRITTMKRMLRMMVERRTSISFSSFFFTVSKSQTRQMRPTIIRNSEYNVPPSITFMHCFLFPA